MQINIRRVALDWIKTVPSRVYMQAIVDRQMDRLMDACPNVQGTSWYIPKAHHKHFLLRWPKSITTTSDITMNFPFTCRVLLHVEPASVAQLDAPSNWRPGGRGFNPHWDRQHSFMEIWSWNIFYGHFLPYADSRRAVVSFWRKNVHNTGNRLED